jgi:hypothetical protein
LRRSHGILSTRTMPQTILLVSRIEALENTRALILEGAGYRTIKTGRLISAVQLSSHFLMSIIGHTFGPEEQDDFIDRFMKEIQAYISYVSLWTNAALGPLHPVVKCFATAPALQGLHHGREQSHRLAEKGFMNDRYGTANPL